MSETWEVQLLRPTKHSVHVPIRRKGLALAWLSTSLSQFLRPAIVLTAAIIEGRMAKFEIPNLRNLFAASRTEEEERTYSRTAFYNLLLFAGSIAAFSFIAQHAGKTQQQLR
ncbi:hypothetical protein FN846DRAFT_902701 [Sphaerosporella brunnea]|uniref:Uncharacterized protein n=1 Tax=Sphaerosporella brunnea TaxID=1250544 RepID=A0A5J5FA46_9PEZI|nr:hypothetical protein FN846DRAFT_902701 [Sphaerosporella brunnea]